MARSLARALGLNETLAEAIALGHDVGHSPFGHLGEDALEPYVPGGWHHAAQGVRIVEVLEHLNLTWEVRDGIRAHSWKIDPPPATREAECVRYADRIGYLSHDALDAIRAGVLRFDDLPARARAVFGEPGSQMVGAMIDAVVEGSLSPGEHGGRRRHGARPTGGHARAADLHVRAGLHVRHRRRSEARGHRRHPPARRPPPGPSGAHPGQLPRHRGRRGHPGRRLRLGDDRPVRAEHARPPVRRRRVVPDDPVAARFSVAPRPGAVP